MKAHYNQTIKVITPFVIPLYESGPWCSAPGARLASPRWVRSRSPRCCKRALSVAHRSGATETKDLERVVVDTTVQEKAVASSPDRRPAHPPRDREAGRSAKREGVELRQSYLRVAKRAAIMVGRYTHAHQFKRAGRQLKFPHTRLGRVIRDLRRKTEGNTALEDRFGPLLDLASPVRHQEPRQRGPKI